ncbi:hypothetical protein B0J11DRAFT_11548 [Dendryphion nanum]|uniref:Uncharacterized protein n=1 Tax=Dendryphion nanum TaxID=256645 RepID=A0A9P9J137_9PLEO|nr:hypothetical protein B0J11DRAFT_11548 [Dendryphion nanum]
MQPPTPNPPRFSDLDDGPETHREEPAYSNVEQLPHAPVSASYIQLPRASTPPVPHPSFSPLLANATFLKSALNTGNRSSGAQEETIFSRTEPRDDLFTSKGTAKKERLQGRLEGLYIGQWYSGAGLSLQESYNRVGVPYPDEIVSLATTKTASAIPTIEVPAVPVPVPIRSKRQIYRGTKYAAADNEKKPPASSKSTQLPFAHATGSRLNSKEDAGELSPSPQFSGSDLSDAPSELEDPIVSPAGNMFLQAAAHIRQSTRAKNNDADKKEVAQQTQPKGTEEKVQAPSDRKDSAVTEFPMKDVLASGADPDQDMDESGGADELTASNQHGTKRKIVVFSPELESDWEMDQVRKPKKKKPIKKKARQATGKTVTKIKKPEAFDNKGDDQTGAAVNDMVDAPGTKKVKVSTTPTINEGPRRSSRRVSKRM